MSWAKASGLMDGNDTGALAPKGAATRAQMAVLLHRWQRYGGAKTI